MIYNKCDKIKQNGPKMLSCGTPIFVYAVVYSTNI